MNLGPEHTAAFSAPALPRPPGETNGPPGGHTGMHAPLSGARQTGNPPHRIFISLGQRPAVWMLGSTAVRACRHDGQQRTSSTCQITPYSQPLDAAIHGPAGDGSRARMRRLPARHAAEHPTQRGSRPPGRLLHRPASLRALMCWASFLGVAACLGTVRNWRAMLTLSGRDLHDAAHSPVQDQGSCASAPGSDALAAGLGTVSLSVRWSHERAASTRSYRMYSCSSLTAGP